MPPDSIRCGQKLFMIDVIRYNGDIVERSIGPYTEVQAGKAQDKLIVEINNQRFYTAIRRATEKELCIV